MESQHEDGPNTANRWFAVHLVTLVVLLLLTLLRFAPPRAKGPDVAADVFSAGRVRGSLERIIQPGVPHPTGSVDHGRVRDAVIEAFRELGFEPEVQDTFSWTETAEAEQVQNIVVHMQGTVGDDAIALVAHYDSVPAGPGVADDGSGVGSILEIARMFAAGPAPRNDVVFLITDGEERGLHGAHAFAAEHPLMDKVRVVLNWEARGTRGPSFMFETGPNNLGLIRLMSQHCRRSNSTSLFPAIYELLPNDTDLTVFKDYEVAGMNFAFIGGSPHYHTPLDNMENLDLGSVQHQGEHFLAMAQALSKARLDDLPQGDAVFFDVLGWFTIWWPQRWNLTFAIGVAVFAVLVLLTTLRSMKETYSRVSLGLMIWPLGLILVAFLGEVACRIVIACTGEAVPWWAWPQPICVALWCLGIGLPIAVWRWTGRGASGQVSSAVMIVYWAVIGILASRYLPGGSYLFTMPAAIACAARLVALWRGFRWEAANLAFLVVVCVLWLPVVRGLIDALGVAPSAGQTIPLALIGLLIAPTVGAGARFSRFFIAIAALGATGLVVAMVVPTYSEKWPQPVSVVYREQDGETYLDAIAHLGHIPDSMREGTSPIVRFDSPRHMVLNVDAGLTAPTLEIQAEEAVENGRRLKLLLKPAAGQHRVILEVAQSFGSAVTVNGRPVPTPLRRLAIDFSERREAEIELTVQGDLELTIVGQSYDLPAAAEPLRGARPVWAVPRGSGDHTRVLTRLKL